MKFIQNLLLEMYVFDIWSNYWVKINVFFWTALLSFLRWKKMFKVFDGYPAQYYNTLVPDYGYRTQLLEFNLMHVGRVI